MGIAKTLMIVGATAVVAVAVTAGVAHMVKRAKERKEIESEAADNVNTPQPLQGSGIRVTSLPRLSIVRRQTPQQETPREDSGINTDGPPPSGVVVRGTAVNGMRPASAHLPGLNLY